MNTVQREVAEVVREHFIRQNRTMHRDGPVDLINADQLKLVTDLVYIFRQQNPSFDVEKFTELTLP